MQIGSLTKERKEELERMAKDKARELEIVKRTSPQQMWIHDLDALEKALVAQNEADAEELAKNGKGKPLKAPLRGKKGKKVIMRPRKGGKKAADAAVAAQAGGAEEAGEEGGDAGGDLGDNPFSDVLRWTAGALAQKTFKLSGGGGPMKRRRQS